MNAPGPPEIAWFHSFRFPDGEEARGLKRLELLEAEAEAIFAPGVAGKSVLDVGAWDGFFSFEAERRGAARVMATDHFCWSGEGWGTRAGFDYAHAKLGSAVETLDIDVPDISPETVGSFDVVLFLGVLYHLKDPLAGLERVAAVARERLVIETETALDILPWPVMRFYEGRELNDDPTNFWAPNRACLAAMLREVGFAGCEIRTSPWMKKHWRRPDLYWKRDRVVAHAWREPTPH
jgi:tRNA (mo5U34)-methyltransferase